MNIEVTRINDRLEEDPAAFVKSINEDYQYQLKRITDEIAKSRREKPVILLSGPSGSGKTTTALMIEKLLDESGCETHTLSLDNYFCPLSEEEKRLAALGQMDLESPDRIDKELLNTQIEAISRCEEVEIPKYDLAESKRKKSNFKIKRSPRQQDMQDIRKRAHPRHLRGHSSSSVKNTPYAAYDTRQELPQPHPPRDYEYVQERRKRREQVHNAV